MRAAAGNGRQTATTGEVGKGLWGGCPFLCLCWLVPLPPPSPPAATAVWQPVLRRIGLEQGHVELRATHGGRCLQPSGRQVRSAGRLQPQAGGRRPSAGRRGLLGPAEGGRRPAKKSGNPFPPLFHTKGDDFFKFFLDSQALATHRLGSESRQSEGFDKQFRQR